MNFINLHNFFPNLNFFLEGTTSSSASINMKLRALMFLKVTHDVHTLIFFLSRPGFVLSSRNRVRGGGGGGGGDIQP